jgi:hypothetical protein
MLLMAIMSHHAVCSLELHHHLPGFGVIGRAHSEVHNIAQQHQLDSVFALLPKTFLKHFLVVNCRFSTRRRMAVLNDTLLLG